MAAPIDLDRLKNELRYYGRGLYEEMSTKKVFIFAQAVAFKVLVTIVPILVLITGVLAQFLHQGESFNATADLFRDFLPSYQSEPLIQFLGELHQASGALTLFGALGLLLSAVTLLTTVRMAVSEAFMQDWNEERSILGGYAFDLRMAVQVGLLFILTVGLSLIAQLLGQEGSMLLQEMGLQYAIRGWEQTLQTAGLVLPFLATFAMFFQLLYYIPRPRSSVRSALFGALTTSLLWEASKSGFTWYATHLGGYSQYAETGQTGELMAGLGSAFALILAFVGWIYYSGLVLMIGAIFASLHEQRRRTRASRD